MSEILEYLFGSREKTRLIRFFLLNSNEEYQVSEIAKKNMIKVDNARRELAKLKKIKFISERIKKGKKYYITNREFPFYPELKNLITKSNIYPQCKSLGRVRGIGDVKLALVSGTFLNYPKSKADMLLVVNNLNRSKLKNLMNSLEAEIGKEIRYVLMDNEEFKYRMNMLDRFMLDFMEEPHDEVVNKVAGLKSFIVGLKNR